MSSQSKWRDNIYRNKLVQVLKINNKKTERPNDLSTVIQGFTLLNSRTGLKKKILLLPEGNLRQH